MQSSKEQQGEIMKKEFIGPGLHLRPVHADHAQPPFQWTLNSVFSAYENNNRRIRPPPDISYLGYSLPKRKHTLITLPPDRP